MCSAWHAVWAPRNTVWPLALEPVSYFYMVALKFQSPAPSQAPASALTGDSHLASWGNFLTLRLFLLEGWGGKGTGKIKHEEALTNLCRQAKPRSEFVHCGWLGSNVEEQIPDSSFPVPRPLPTSPSSPWPEGILRSSHTPLSICTLRHR